MSTINTVEFLQFQCMVFLESLVNNFTHYTSTLKGDDVLLKPIFDELAKKNMVKVNKDGDYIATSSGKAAVKCFLERKQEWLALFDVYSKVDLETGEFAWEQQVSASEIPSMLGDKRWSDLRLAVAEFKGLYLAECVLFICLEEWEGRHVPGLTTKWQKHFLDENTWGWVETYLNGLLVASDLSFKDDEGEFDGREVVKNIILAGAQINLFTHRNLGTKAEAASTLSDKFDVTVPDQMDRNAPKNYLKASYVSPCWKVNLCSGKLLKRPQKAYW